MDNKPMTILHVEDSDEHAELFAEAIAVGQMPFRLVRVSSAEDALEYLASRQVQPDDNREIPDLIFFDLSLPGLSGLELLRRIKSQESTRRIPAIILTSSDNADDIAEAYRLGVNSYVVKPSSLNEFIIKLAELSMYWGVTAEVPGFQHSLR